MAKLNIFKTLSIPLSDLYFQYEPEGITSFQTDLFLGSTLTEKLNVFSTPHYEFAVLFDKLGESLLMDFEGTRYVQLMKRWGRDHKHNIWKTNRFWNTFSSIKKKGFIGCIQVLESPKNEDHISSVGGFEIYHGHHRSAICAALGHKTIKCNVARERK